MLKTLMTNDERSSNTYWWYYNSTPPASEYHVTSYVWLLQRNDKAKPDPAGFVAPRTSFVQKMSVSYTNNVTLTDSELVMDIVVSDGTDKFTGTYTSNPQILPNGYTPNHMNGIHPTGGNILFQDNHVSWRQFKKMQLRYKWTNNRNFWW